MPGFQLHCGILSDNMAFTSQNRRCIQATTLLFISLIILQLVLTTVDAETRGNRKNTRGNRKHSPRRTAHNVDYPRLLGGHSYPRKNHHQRHEDHQPVVPISNEIIEPQQDPSQGVTEQEELAADFEAKKNIRIAQIKENILRQLNLGTPPNVSGIVETSNPSVKEMIDEVDESNKRIPHDSDYMADVPVQLKKTFIPVEEHYPFDYKLPDNADVMYFKLNQGEINMAELHLWIKPVPASVADKIALRVFKVLEPARPNGLVRYNRISNSVETVNAEKGAWTKIPVFSMVSEWTRDPATNLGMVVEMFDTNDQQIIVTNATEMPSKAPLLEVRFVHEGPSHRPTRSSEGGKCSDGETRCCRFPLPINFTEYSFDFIVAPKVYMANFCNGKCGYLYAQQVIHQSVVQKLHNSTATYGPCCGAKELMPLNMLYYDHDRKIRFDTINNMVIEKCSCD